jgi:hypothetical protein
MKTKLTQLEQVCAVAEMCNWFLRNFENPAESLPFDEGEYVYLWGGPVDAGEEIYHKFDGVYSEELIAAAAEKLEAEHDAYNWSPMPPHEDEMEDDEDESEVT